MQLFCFLLKQFFENVKKKFMSEGFREGRSGVFREGRSGYSKQNFFLFHLTGGLTGLIILLLINRDVL